MNVRQTWQWKNRDGRDVIDLNQWAQHLPQEQAEEYQASVQRQFQLRQEAIDREDMHIDPDTGFYVWKDMQTANKGKFNDPVWDKYWQKYVVAVDLDTDSLSKFIEE